jgi:hypothetical protein
MMQFARIARAACLGAAALALSHAAAATLSSESSPFGPDTITRDSETDYGWLDLTLTAGLSRSAILTELGPGGTFDGFELATEQQVAELFANAGIDIDPSVLDDFVPQNYAPVSALAALLGQLSANGNCGSGCTFFASAGYIDGPSPSPGFFPVATLAWFDNSAPQNPSYPQAPIGRVSLASSTQGAASSSLGAFLIPEPASPLLVCAGSVVLAAAARSRLRTRARTRAEGRAG